MKLEFFIALRYLVRRKKAGFVSVISLISITGVAVGVMALIVVLAVMSGFDRELKSKIVGVQPHVVIQQHGGLEEHEALAGKIRSLELPKIKSIAPYVTGQGIVRSENNAQGVVIKGIDPQTEGLSFFQDYLREGSLRFDVEEENLEEEVKSGILLGAGLAQQLRVFPGDIVQVISPTLEKKGIFKKSARTESFRVNGLFHFGMYDVDTTMLLMHVQDAKSLYNLGDRVTGISLKLEDVYWAERVKSLLYDNLDFNYWIQTWIDSNRNFFAALKVEKKVMTILLFLIILVAAFNIVSTLIMVVMEKTKDIGILKSLGATHQTVQNIFILEGCIVGLFGTAIGVASGLLVANWLNPIADLIQTATGFEIFPSDIYFFDKIPTQINTLDVILVACFAFLMTVVAGWYPAKKAAALKPIEGLRYE